MRKKIHIKRYLKYHINKKGGECPREIRSHICNCLARINASLRLIRRKKPHDSLAIGIIKESLKRFSSTIFSVELLLSMLGFENSFVEYKKLIRIRTAK
jgi:hypothetical protein